MLILGIETSCDETSAAILDGKKIISNIIFSQIEKHKIFGGVVPEIAAREHLNQLPMVVSKCFKDADMRLNQIDAVAVTYGPGLAGSLIVGLSYGKAMAFALKKKFIGINHLEAHLLSPFIEYDNFDFPFIGLVVSGGHTNVYIAEEFGKYKLIGSTRDDAAGEAFDKVAKLLGLPYPGGPAISKAAKEGNAKKIVFPQAQMKDKSFDFSFSGIKTSVLYFLKKNENKIKKGEITREDIAAAFQKAAIRTIVNKIKRVYKKYKIKNVAITGGVAANSFLKEEIKILADEKNLNFFIPSPILCTDNGAMVAYTGYMYLKHNKFSEWNLDIVPELKL